MLNVMLVNSGLEPRIKTVLLYMSSYVRRASKNAIFLRHCKNHFTQNCLLSIN